MRMFERMIGLRNQGLIYSEIADRLAAENLLARNGSAWHVGSIAKIIKRVQIEAALKLRFSS